jgi:cytochrome c oxidase cbb3-type subunit 1
MWDWIKIVSLGLVALAAIIANWARDTGYQVHALIVMDVAAGLFIWTLRNADEPKGPAPTSYNDRVIRAGVIATTFWGLAGFLVGVFIAFQLAFPALNVELLKGYGNFGCLRPLHTSSHYGWHIARLPPPKPQHQSRSIGLQIGLTATAPA